MSEQPLSKPRYGQPCNHCGICCQLSLCPAAVLFLPPETQAPCPAITHVEGKFLCGLVIAEKERGESHVAELLGVGDGCSMQDPETTDEEVAAADWESLRKALQLNPNQPSHDTHTNTHA